MKTMAADLLESTNYSNYYNDFNAAAFVLFSFSCYRVYPTHTHRLTGYFFALISYVSAVYAMIAGYWSLLAILCAALYAFQPHSVCPYPTCVLSARTSYQSIIKFQTLLLLDLSCQ